MNIIELTGTEGTIYSLAETLDTTCYRGSFQPSTVAPTPSMVTPSPSPTLTPSPAFSALLFDCARYTAQCVDTSVTPEYANCAATVAANPSGMTCRIEHLGRITDGDSATQTQHCPHAQETARGPCASENPLASFLPSPSPTPLPLPANSCAAAARTYMEAGCCGQPAKMLDATGLTCITHRIAYQSSNCCNNPTGDFSLTPADTSSSPEAGRLLLESLPLDEMPRLELDYFWTPGSDEM